MWLLEDYENHYLWADDFYKSEIYKYIIDKIPADEKIVINKRNNHFTYLTHRISLSYFNYPFYFIFENDPKILFKNLAKLKINYLMIIKGEKFIAPYRPLLLQRDFALKHLEIVATHRWNGYLENDEYFLRYVQGKEISKNENYKPFYNIILFRISEEEITQTDESIVVINDIIDNIIIDDIYDDDITKIIKHLSLNNQLIERINAFDKMLMQ